MRHLVPLNIFYKIRNRLFPAINRFYTIICLLHTNLRMTDFIMHEICTEADNMGTLDELVADVENLGFSYIISKNEDGDLSVPTVNGNKCVKILNNICLESM